ncbi:hypothetical protein ACLBWT_17380 [Paenibacillus sp. D51F]
MWTKEQLRAFIKENKLVTAQDAQNALKDLFAETIQEMLEAEMDTHLGYEEHETKAKMSLAIVVPEGSRRADSDHSERVRTDAASQPLLTLPAQKKKLPFAEGSFLLSLAAPPRSCSAAAVREDARADSERMSWTR